MSRRPGLLHHRLPAAPLEAALHRAGVLVGDLPQTLQRRIYRGRLEGTVTRTAGDVIACRVLGEHPALIWGEAWWDLDPTPLTPTT